MKYGNYNEVVEGAKCTICQFDFDDSEDIVIFDCDPTHYFHKKCGLEWLDIKTECPLCRKDFENEIMSLVMVNDKKLIKKLSENVDPQDVGMNEEEE